MKKYLVTVMALLALTGLVLLAADIDGTWSVTTEGGRGPQTTTLTLASKGTALTGKMEGGRGGPADISDGKVEGSNVMFKVTRDNGRGPQTTEYKGTVSATELKLAFEGRGGPQELVLKKK